MQYNGLQEPAYDIIFLLLASIVWYICIIFLLKLLVRAECMRYASPNAVANFLLEGLDLGIWICACKVILIQKGEKMQKNYGQPPIC